VSEYINLAQQLTIHSTKVFPQNNCTGTH